MNKKSKWIAIVLIAIALVAFSQSAGADICWYAEGAICKESL